MSDEREIEAIPISMPSHFQQLAEGRLWMRNLVGEAGASVYRLIGSPGVPDLYVKHGVASVADDIADEMVRLRWAAGHFAVPRVEAFAALSQEAWLLTTALPGRTAYQWLQDDPTRGAEIADLLAAFLRRLHAAPVDRCPFDSGHTLRLALARDRMESGLVDVDDFDETHTGWTAGQVWDEITALLPLDLDPVVTHGDFSLDNILIADGVVTGCIDLGRLGVADRYQDIAILWNCLGEFDAALQARFVATYGLDTPDERKLRFHLGLDEFF
jgi:aminoglycoside 3'-phosphotransferase-1